MIQTPPRFDQVVLELPRRLLVVLSPQLPQHLHHQLWAEAQLKNLKFLLLLKPELPSRPCGFSEAFS